MNKVNFQNIFSVLFIFLFLSSGMLSNAYSKIDCGSEPCCETACCESDNNSGIPFESSLNADNKCCDIDQGIQNDTKNTLFYTPTTNFNTPITFYHSDYASLKEKNKIFLREFLYHSHINQNFIPALRI